MSRFCESTRGLLPLMLVCLMNKEWKWRFIFYIMMAISVQKLFQYVGYVVNSTTHVIVL